jgi:hypothetical protein
MSSKSITFADRLQQYLEQKLAQGLSLSVVDHVRWDLRAIIEA